MNPDPAPQEPLPDGLEGLVWQFTYARSGGPGGQNVNKVASKAILRWSLVHAQLPETVKIRFQQLFPTALTTAGDVVLSSQVYRDQERNRQACLQKLARMIQAARVVPKVRRATKPTKSSQRRRLADKKQNAERKAARRTPPPSE